MLCSTHGDALANCQTVSNNDHSNGTDNNYTNETETSVGFTFMGTASSSPATTKPINSSNIAVYDSSSNNWTDLFSTVDSMLASSPSGNGTIGASVGGAGGFGSEVMIPLYSVIFILSVLGNILVIVTLTQNRRMRTVTNVFLLNLVSVICCFVFNRAKITRYKSYMRAMLGSVPHHLDAYTADWPLWHPEPAKLTSYHCRLHIGCYSVMYTSTQKNSLTIALSLLHNEPSSFKLTALRIACFWRVAAPPTSTVPFAIPHFVDL